MRKEEGSYNTGKTKEDDISYKLNEVRKIEKKRTREEMSMAALMKEILANLPHTPLPASSIS